MRAIFAATLLFSVLTASAASAEDQPAQAAKPAKEKKICQDQKISGSHVPRTTCHTVAEWEQIAEDNKASVQAFSDGRNNTSGKKDTLKF